jgi:hypothetical protein
MKPMSSTGEKWTLRRRILAMQQGSKPDRNPFIDRMDIRYKGRNQREKAPEEFQFIMKMILLSPSRLMQEIRSPGVHP